MSECQVLGVINVYNKQLRHLATIKHRDMNVADISVDGSLQSTMVNNRNGICCH